MQLLPISIWVLLIRFSWCWTGLPPSPSSLLWRHRRRSHNILYGEVPPPPIAYRDETDFVLAGELPFSTEDDDATPTTLLRQSPSSPHPLLSPPRRIPNPYGWMRDDTRTNTTILDHLHAENEYGQQTTSQLADLREKLYQEVSTQFSLLQCQ